MESITVSVAEENGSISNVREPFGWGSEKGTTGNKLDVIQSVTGQKMFYKKALFK